MQLIQTWKDRQGLNRCLRLVGLPKSTWYARQKTSEEPSAEEKQLREQLRVIIRAHPGYGWRKLQAELTDRGETVNHKRLKRVLRQADLHLLRSVPRPGPSGAQQVLAAHKGQLNRLEGRRFGPFELLSGDFTELKWARGARKGWLGAFYDPAGRLPCGAAVGKSANTDLALEAWQKVRRWFNRHRKPLQGTVVHTDQDPVFKSYRWLGTLLHEDHLEVSFSERGAKDNPWIESLLSRLKEEVGDRIYQAPSINEVREVVNEYVVYYRTRRRHQSLDYQIPMELLTNQNDNNRHHPSDLQQLVL